MNCLVFIGFKGVGKTVLGRAMAEKLGREFLDLDEEVEKQYAREQGEELRCREIFAQHGEPFFRELEQRVFTEILEGNLLKEASVLALGGGAVLREESRAILERLKNNGTLYIVHVTAPPETVFERIMAQGRPAVFPDGLSDRESFEKLWQQRLPLYENLAHGEVENSRSLEDGLDELHKKFGNLSFFC